MAEQPAQQIVQKEGNHHLPNIHIVNVADDLPRSLSRNLDFPTAPFRLYTHLSENLYSK